MTQEMKDFAVRTITRNILTPVIYMIEQEDSIDFICFCDRRITMQEVYDTEHIIYAETNKHIEILDIREFRESDRIEVINQATLIYSEHPFIEMVFTRSMLEDFKNAMDDRNNVLERYRESGTYYLQ